VLSVLVLAGFAAACGSSSSSNNNTTNSTASGGGGSSTPSSGPISTSSGGGVSDSTFCSLAKKWAANNAKETSALTGAANGDLKTFYTTLAKEYQQIVSAAPSEIKPDLNVLVGVFDKFYVVLQQNNFDLQKAAPKLAGLAQDFNSTQVKQAEAHLEAWSKANSCNFKS
jgi:hypothetical protein